MNKFLSAFAILSILFVYTQPVYAQYEEDTKTVDSTIEALYEVISGPIGQERDWDRFENLFVPSAQLLPVVTTPDSSYIRVMSYADYREIAGPWLVQNGFFEIELARTQEEYGHIVHAFSTYGSYKTAEDVENANPYDKGINSIQLMNDGERWFVVNVMWDAESMGAQIPEKYLSAR